MAILLENPDEGRDRRMKMLLDTVTTAFQLQTQKQQVQQQGQYQQGQLSQDAQRIALLDPAQNKYLRADMATQNRARMADARYKENSMSSGREWKPRTIEEAMQFEQSKLQLKKDNPSPYDQKALMDIEDRKTAQESAKQNVLESAQSTIDTISEIEKGSKFFGARSLIPGIPGTEKTKWDANFNKLKANLVINLMTAMKNASKTGATGFGQLNRDELKVLQDGATALKGTMSWDDAKPILDGMKEKLNKIASGDESSSELKLTGKTKSLYDKYAGL